VKAVAAVAMLVLAGCSSSSGEPPQKQAPPMRKPYATTPADRIGVLAPGTGVPVGQRVPDVHARDLDGKDVALSALYAKQPVLLAFYRGGWCPYCNTEIHELVAAYPEFQKRGVALVAASVDTPDAEAKLHATYSIPFAVLSDSDAAMIEAFHVVKHVEGDELAKMKSFGVDLEQYSGKTHHEIAMPSLFLIDRAGIVRWAHSDQDFKVRPSVAQMLAAIDQAKLTGAEGSP
jgi:peroxiredoxin